MRNKKQQSKGTAMVELAIVLPLLLLIIGVGIDFLFAFQERVVLLEAARVGARVGSGARFLAGNDPMTVSNTIVAVAQSHLSDAGYDVGEYQVAVSTETLSLPTTGASPAVRVVVFRNSNYHGIFFPNTFFPRCAGSAFRSEIRLEPSATAVEPRC